MSEDNKINISSEDPTPISSKFLSLLAVQDMLKVWRETNNDNTIALQLYTSLGVIEGEVIKLPSKNEKVSPLLENGTLNLNYIEDMKTALCNNDNLIEFGDGSTINLQNVTLISDGNKHSFAQMSLFCDQIIGYSIGKISLS